jgi:hypothetical protein
MFQRIKPYRFYHTQPEAWKYKTYSVAYEGCSKGNVQTDCAMAQVARCWPVTVETQICARFSLCGICGGRSGIGTCFPLEFFTFPVNIFPLWLSILIYCLGD